MQTVLSFNTSVFHYQKMNQFVVTQIMWGLLYLFHLKVIMIAIRFLFLNTCQTNWGAEQWTFQIYGFGTSGKLYWWDMHHLSFSMGPMGCSTTELKTYSQYCVWSAGCRTIGLQDQRALERIWVPIWRTNGFSDKWTVRPKRRQTSGLNALDYWTIEPFGCSTNGTNM